MDCENPTGLQVEPWLKTLGIDLLTQWDVLVFLFRHPASLVSAEHIARLLGFATAPVVDALAHLESLEFVARSRTHQGVRLYQFTTPAQPSRNDVLERLMPLADNRALRLLLAQKLRGMRFDSNSRVSHLLRQEGIAP
jgi:DNA-binding MarR family transcriptional regulator